MRPCPNAIHMGKFACADRSQCWEPCGELGNDDAHVRVAPPHVAIMAGQVWKRKVKARYAHDYLRVEKASPSGKTLRAVGCDAAGRRVSVFGASELRSWRLLRDYELLTPMKRVQS